MGIFHSEPGRQGARVAASEGDNGRVVGLVLLADVENELSSISEGLLRRKPFQILSVQLREWLRLSIVTMLDTDLKSLVLSSIHSHSAASDHERRCGAFSSKGQEDGRSSRRSGPELVRDPVTLRKSAVILMIVVIETLLIRQSLNGGRRRRSNGGDF